MNENTKNTNNNANENTMNALKRARSIVVYDKHNNAKLVQVSKESETEYQLSNKKKIEKADALANISKNRYNTYTREDSTTFKSYHSHVESFKDVHSLFEVVKTVFDDAKETQYFVFAKERNIKLRIQKSSVEIMSKALENNENAHTCENAKDATAYSKYVTATTKDDVLKVLETLK